MMLWVFLLQLFNSLAGSSGAGHETLCTSKACFTLHTDRVSFEKAGQNCDHNGGYLMTVRSREEEDVLRSLLSQIQRQPRDRALKFWIGLKLHRGNCVRADRSLRGFKWVSGEEDSNYSNWEKEPVTTCTEERCAKVHHTASDQNQLKWTAGTCKSPSFYACKFFFKGMCRPLALSGRGQITYRAPFSEEPQRSEMEVFPLGTFADISCGDQRSHYSVCMGHDDTYRWTEPGPFCATGARHCAQNNGGCEHLCHQDADGVRCFCKEGYDLDQDGLTCRMKATCGAETCEHRCVMGETGFSCTCPDGFELDANLRNCSDVDECQSQACTDQLCLNTHGSYTCACRAGYQALGGKCVDVDECARASCEHSCSNSVGSFSCSCHEGFAPSEDGHSCVDIDECLSDACQYTCVNAVGSFWCACPRGFHSEGDGSACLPNVTGASAAEEETQEDVTESFGGTTVELQHEAPRTDATVVELANDTREAQQRNTSSVTGVAKTVDSRVLVCVLGSVIPLLLLLAVTLAIAIVRCSRSQKEAKKKKKNTDGYCWVPSGLDPRLEKLYESILTDDL